MTRDSTAPPPAGAPAEAVVEPEIETVPAPGAEGLAIAAPVSAPVIADRGEVTAPGTEPTTGLNPYRTPSGEPPEIDPAQLDVDALKVVSRLRQFATRRTWSAAACATCCSASGPKISTSA